jgi:chromosome segregation ATPase
MGSIKLILVLMVISAAGAGYMYVQSLQKNLQTAVANAAKLETAVALNEQTISTLQSDMRRANQELQRVNSEFAAARAQNNMLTERLRDHDLGLLAQTRPDTIARLINRGTVNAGRCFELLSGAPLNQRESQAQTANDFNRECPWLWPGAQQ